MKYLKRHVARTVVVTLVPEDRSFRGTLAHADADSVTLTHAAMVEPDIGQFDGQIVIPASQVAWVQVV